MPKPMPDPTEARVDRPGSGATGDGSAPAQDTLFVLRLEGRLLLDAAAGGVGVEAATSPDDGTEGPGGDGSDPAARPSPTDPDKAAGDALAAQALAEAGPPDSREVVFVDTGVEGWQTLADGVDPDADLVQVGPNEDGVRVMADTLAGRSDVRAVHVIGHGGPGWFELGRANVDAGSLAGYAAEFDSIAAALAPGADLLLYGCYVAADGDGQAFVDALAGLTGADVAASADATGASNLGGDWQLEIATGDVEADVAVAANARAAFSTLLTTFDFSSGTVSGSGTTVVTQSYAGNTLTASAPDALTVASGSYLSGDYLQVFFTDYVEFGLNYGQSFYLNSFDFYVPSSGYYIATGYLSEGYVDSGLFYASSSGTFVASGGIDPLVGQFDSVRIESDSGSSINYFFLDNVDATPVNTAPSITDFAGDSLSYDEDDGAVTVDQGTSAAVTDDSADFDGGNLTVAIVSGGDETEDQLGLSTAGGFVQLGATTAGATVSVDANGGGDSFVPVGTLVNDIAPGNDLVIDFNTSADATTAQTLLRNVTYENTETATPTEGSRTVRATVSDGDGATSANADATVAVTSVNDAPTIAGLPTSVTVVEDQPSDVDLSPVTLGDVDAGSNTVELTIAAGSGTLSATGSPGVTVAGSGTGSLTLTGQLADIDGFLDTPSNIQYLGTNDAAGFEVDTLTLVLDDQGNSGVDPGSTGGPSSETAVATLTVDATPVNDAPTIAGLPEIVTVTEDLASDLDLSPVTLGDVDAGTGTVELTIAAGSGTLSTSGSPGVTVAGSGTGNLTLTGPVADIDSFLNTAGAIQYTTAPNANGSAVDTLTLTLDDQGNTGGPGAETATATLTVDATPVNDAPTIAGVPEIVTVTEDQPSNLDLSAATLGDVDAGTGNVTLTIAAGSGTLSASGSPEVTIAGSGTGSLTLTGQLADIDGFLNTPSNLQYTGAPDAAGSAVDTLTLVLDDQGNSGVYPGSTGGPSSETATATVTVDATPVNDAPTIGGVPASVTVTEDQPSDLDLSPVTLGDIDAGTGTVELTIMAGSGTLSATGSPGVTVAGSGTGSLTLTGQLADIDSVLNTAGAIQYTGAPDAAGSAVDTLTLVLDDQGNTGADPGSTGGPSSETATATVTVDATPVNDAPGFTGDAALPGIAEDAADPGGATVAGLFGDLFADPDAADTLAGVAVTGDASAPAEGTWQLQIAGSDWIDLPAVSAGDALVLSAATALRFQPAADFNGTPGGLSLRAVDSSYTGGFSSAAGGTLSPVTRDLTGTGSGGTTAFAPSDAALDIAVDPVPDVTGIAVADGTYGIGDTVTVTVGFDQAVVVDTAGGTPGLDVRIAGTPRTAGFAGALGAQTLSFTTTIRPGDGDDADGIAVVADSLSAGGGTIRDPGGDDADLAHGAANDGGETVDTTRPTASVTLDDTALGAGESAAVTIAFSEPVSGFALADISAANASLAALSSPDGRTYTATLTPDPDAEALSGTLSVDLAGVTDAAGNPGTGTSGSPAYAVDTLAPRLSAELSVSEAAAPGTPAGSVSATDASTVTFALSDDSGGRFAIDADSGQITLAPGAALDHESEPTTAVTVQAADTLGNTRTRSFTVTIADANEAPRITSAPTAVVAEGDTAVTTVRASDPDRGDGLRFAIAGGADAAAFRIDQATGALSFADAPDFEQPRDADGDNVYRVAVAASDPAGLSATQRLAVTVTDTDDTPRPGGPTEIAVPEGRSVVTQLPGFREFALAITGGADLTLFKVDADGTLIFADPPDHDQPADADGDNLYEVVVLGTRFGGPSTTWTLAVTVTERNEAPRAVTGIPDQDADTGETFRFRVPPGSFADANSDDRLTLSATRADGGPLPGWLSFAPATGTFSGTPGDADAGRIELRVTATDDAGLSAQSDFTILVQDTTEETPGSDAASRDDTDADEGDQSNQKTGSTDPVERTETGGEDTDRETASPDQRGDPDREPPEISVAARGPVLSTTIETSAGTVQLVTSQSLSSAELQSFAASLGQGDTQFDQSFRDAAARSAEQPSLALETALGDPATRAALAELDLLAGETLIYRDGQWEGIDLKALFGATAPQADAGTPEGATLARAAPPDGPAASTAAPEPGSDAESKTAAAAAAPAETDPGQPGPAAAERLATARGLQRDLWVELAIAALAESDGATLEAHRGPADAAAGRHGFQAQLADRADAFDREADRLAQALLTSRPG